MSEDIEAKWKIVAAPIRLTKRCGSMCGANSPLATPSAISARNQSTSARPARASGEPSPGCALAASRRIRRASVGRSRHVVDPGAHRGLEPRLCVATRRQRRREAAENVVEHRRVELLLVGEVVEDRRAPDADVGGNVLEARGLEAALGEVALGGRQDRGARLLAAAPGGIRAAGSLYR